MKVCPLCTYQNPDSVRFCVQCQHRFGAPVPATPPPAAPDVRPGKLADVTPASTQTPASPEKMHQPPKPADRPPEPRPSRPAPVRQHTTFKRVPNFEDPAVVPTGTESSGRKIVAVLITYSWKPEGQLFPVREGRNLIGRDPDQCEIAIPEDSALSARNTVISYRATFRIADDDSMSGTYVDGEALELRESRPLANYSTIRTGSTDWLFIAIEPGTTS